MKDLGAIDKHQVQIFQLNRDLFVILLLRILQNKVKQPKSPESKCQLVKLGLCPIVVHIVPNIP
jgi:hypothetical protein